MAGQLPSDADRAWRNAGDSASFAELIQNIVTDIQGLVRSEIRLAKTEISEDVATTGRASSLLVGGVMLAFYAVGFLLLTFVYALGTAMPNWLAALIVAIVVAIVAGVLAMLGYQRIKQVNFKPEQTIDTVKEDVEWVKQQAK
ncbi:MAG TPA: phage holin family protein [Nitrolancea sp.]|jgi:uncharacterized membrane protein YqjE|nr:phage holin family protein [Nitrolancea sp.]